MRVLRFLADGEFHSGEGLAHALDVSRGSIWHAIRELETLGLDIYKVRGRGYRVSKPVCLLEQSKIRSQLGSLAPHFSLELATSIESTSTRLLELAARGAASGTVVAAEWQSGGRGRFARTWHAAVGGSLLFSLLWRFERGVGALSGLSLAAGVAVARGLEALGASAIAVKWPNDLLWNGRKLAGILIELQGDALGPTAAVIGVGVNVRLSETDRARIGQPAADLEETCGAAPDRNAALARVLAELHRALEVFGKKGFGPLRGEWERRHAHRDALITLLVPGGARATGRARGVGDDGALLLETGAGIERHHSGEISLRSARSATSDA